MLSESVAGWISYIIYISRKKDVNISLFRFKVALGSA